MEDAYDPGVVRRRGVAVGLQGRVAVALTGVGDDLGLVARGEVRTRESQPYHDAQDMALDEAERYIAAAADAAVERATGDLRRFVDEVAASGLDVVCIGLVTREYRLPKTLAATLRSHPALHAAEGQMTIDALAGAGNALGIEVVATSDQRIDSRADSAGKLVGPPWRKEQKLAATAALRALASR